MKDLPNEKLSTRNMTSKEEIKLKKQRAGVLDKEKKWIDDSMRELEGKFDMLKLSRATIADPSFDLRFAEKKMPLNLCVWEVRFKSDMRAQRMAYIAAHKYNWSIFLLALHKTTNACIVGKGEIAQMTEHHKEINMRNVTVSRKRHGMGMFHYPDERGIYSGRFRHGLRHGQGTELSQLGRYQGSFRLDWRAGPGSFIFASGNTLRCNFGRPRFHVRESLLFGDEYADGVPHGAGSAKFVDGSEYIGEFYDGVPLGSGRYVSATGDVCEGEFGAWGALDGFGTHLSGPVMRVGLWRNGLIHGEGAEVDADLGDYEGDFRRGERSGYGLHHSKVVNGVYEGWWKYGQRNGRGTLNFGNITRDEDELRRRREQIIEENRARAAMGAAGRIPIGLAAIAADKAERMKEPTRLPTSQFEAREVRFHIPSACCSSRLRSLPPPPFPPYPLSFSRARLK